MKDYKRFKEVGSPEERYIILNTLGKGAFGTVKVCQHKISKQKYAIKIISKEAINKK